VPSCIELSKEGSGVADGGFFLALILISCAFAQQSADTSVPTQTEPAHSESAGSQPGPGHQIGSGVGTIGLGAAKGAGHLALGTVKGVGKLVTLHPVGAGVSVAKGAASAGKDVTVGTVKGTGRVGKGVGREIKKIH